MQLIYFLIACSALTMSPGPDMLYVLAKGAEKGRRAALFTAWGMCTGCLVHTFAVAFGFAQLCASNPRVFLAVKFGGAAYLFWLAWKTIRGAHPEPVLQAASEDDGRTFLRGALMNVMNPKVLLFFIAFLPQFWNRSSSVPVAGQMITLGLLFMAQGFFWFTLLAWFSGWIGDFIRRSPKLLRAMPYLSGAILVLIALGAVVAEI